MGGSGGIIIVGDEPLVEAIEEHIGNVAPFRRSRARDIIAAYHANENSITREDQQFLLRCAADIVENS